MRRRLAVRSDPAGVLSSAVRPVGGMIALLASRRALTLVAALLPRRERSPQVETAPSVAIVVPIFNEAKSLPQLLTALDRLDYPRDRLSVLLIDDGSVDGSSALIRAWTEERSTARAIRLAGQVGKGAALNAVRAEVHSDLTLVCDADVRPRPDLLRALVRPFADPRVGAVSAYLAPDHDRGGIAAGYASLESLVHQLVTCTGKDRLSLDPPVHGCAAYRTSALESIDWFSTSGPGEDVRVSVALSRSGWRTRFAEDAVADNPVVISWDAYWRQHVRWSRNLLRAGDADGGPAPRRQSDAPGWRLARGVERTLTSAGYADRLILAAAVALGVRRRIPGWLAGLYPAVIASELIAAVVRAGRGRHLPRYLLIAIAGVAVDMLATVAAIWAHLRRRPHVWPTTATHRQDPAG